MKNGKNTYKYDRVSSEVKRIVSEVVSMELSDERVCGKAEVTDIILSKDFSFCKVFVYIRSENKKEVLEGLKNANGYIRHAVLDNLDLKKSPTFMFVDDDTIDKAKHIEELLEKIKQK